MYSLITIGIFVLMNWNSPTSNWGCYAFCLLASIVRFAAFKVSYERLRNDFSRLHLQYISRYGYAGLTPEEQNPQSFAGNAASLVGAAGASDMSSTAVGFAVFAAEALFSEVRDLASTTREQRELRGRLRQAKSQMESQSAHLTLYYCFVILGILAWQRWDLVAAFGRWLEQWLAMP
jgi:hypothetical protein